jgi:branched-chain amino acid transport system substrate-binding protein
VKSEARTYDRRKFVAIAGAGAAGAVAAPLVLTRNGRAADTIKLDIGVITPTGSSYTNMGQSLLDGLTLGLDHARDVPGSKQLSVRLETRTVDRGYGGALPTAQGLLDDGADLVVAGVSALVAGQLGGLFAERNTPLVVAGVGAHLVPPGARQSQVLHNTLLYWQAGFAAGRWVATHLGKRAFIASALSDSGYDALFAFRRGFESEGGTVVGDAVTHVHPGATGLPELVTAVRSSGADVVYGVYSGIQAAEFVQAYAASGISAPLVAGSLAVEDYLLKGIGAASLGALSCSSWTQSRKTKANHAFRAAFTDRFHRPADPFAALGYDTAALIARGARLAAKQGRGTSGLIDALHGVTLTGPRGTLTVDGATNTVMGPLWMRKVEHSPRGFVNVEVANAPAVGSFPLALSVLGEQTVAGYVNEYTCA